MVNDIEENNIKESDVKNLTVLKSEKGVKENYSEDCIRNNVEKLEAKYDIIIIDSSNILNSADAMVVAKVVKNIVLVVSERKTKIEDVVRAKKCIDDIGGNVIGNVLKNTVKS